MDFEAALNHPAVFVITVIVAAFVVTRILRKFVFRWLRETASRTKTKLDDIIITETNSAISILVYLVALYYIVSYFVNLPGLKEALIAVGVFVAGRAVVNIILGAFREYIHLLPLEDDQKGLLLGMEGSIRAVLYVIVVLVMLASLGIDVWPIITSLGVGGLAISLALKDVLTDYVSGIIVILGRSLKKGDRIMVKDKGVEGIVEQVGWRYTVLRTDDGELITVPNRVMSSSVIIFKGEGNGSS